MHGIIDIERIRLKRQPHEFTDTEFPAHAEIHVRIVRSKQSKRRGPRDVADCIRCRIDEGSLVQVRRGGYTLAPAAECTLDPQGSAQGRIVFLTAGAHAACARTAATNAPTRSATSAAHPG